MSSVHELFVKNKVAVGGGILALVLISWLCWYFSATQVIKRQLVGLTWEVNKKSSQESTMETALKMREVKAALTESCRVTVPETHFNDVLERDSAIMYLMYYRDRYETISVSFERMNITFPAKTEAAVRANVLLKRQKGQAAPAGVAAPALLTLKKESGGWRLTQVELDAALVND